MPNHYEVGPADTQDFEVVEMTEMPERTHEHDPDPEGSIGEPVHVDYDTGEVRPVGQPDPDPRTD